MRGPGIVALLAAGFALVFLFPRLFPAVPVAHPVTIRGGTRAEPLADALADFKADQIVHVTASDAIRAIDRPELDSADRSRLSPDELVIGVEIAGEARAYPIRVLSAHEIVNDEIAGKPYAVTW